MRPARYALTDYRTHAQYVGAALDQYSDVWLPSLSESTRQGIVARLDDMATCAAVLGDTDLADRICEVADAFYVAVGLP